MKRLTLTFITLCGFCGWTYAGPQPLLSKEIAPVPPPPTSCFQGWYFGAHGGGLLLEFDSETSAFEETVSPRGGSESVFASTGKRHGEATWEGGLHAGYNFQRGAWVFGLEVDIQGTDFQRTGFASDLIQFNTDSNGGREVYATQITSKTELDWYSTGRLRIGHTLGERVMPFITGGGAVGLAGVSEVTGVHGEKPFPRNASFTDQFSDSDRQIHGGWTAGAGIDFCLTEHWMLNFTYLYVDLGDSSASTSFLTTLPASERSGVRSYDSETRVSSDLKFHVFQGGLTFHF